MSDFFRRLGLALVAASLFLAPVAALAAAPVPSPALSPSAIAASRETGEDDRIRQRITGIFAVLPSLEGVSVSVSEGW
ncbi:MAG: hypothetical protein ABIT16_05835 [Croceibacterium sp.]